MAYVLALASAAFYGAADFIGGMASRRSATIAVVALSHLAGLALVGLALPLLPPSAPDAGAISWGIVSGLTGGVGVALLYHALAIGTVSIVAPTTAVCAVLIPVLAGIARGERPAAPVTIGMILAIVAIALVSRASADSTEPDQPNHGNAARGLQLGLAAGVGFGLFFLALAQTGPDAGLWPLLVARVTSSSLFIVAAFALSIPLAMPKSVAFITIVAGSLDMLANIAYLIAVREGALSVVATLTSLYPAGTVLLARIVLKERLNRWQSVGIICALAAVALIAGGSTS
jgi:drug/metabolite transporter (DMT)-like permease